MSQKLQRAFRLALAGLTVGLVASFGVVAGAADNLTHYDSNNKQFWEHPPADWFMGDMNKTQKGEDYRLTSGPATGISGAALEENLKKIKLPKGFHIAVYADHVLSARQMALGDKGTLFVGSFSLGVVYAVTGEEGHKQVKTILKGLQMPTGLAFRDGTLYVADINKILAYPDAEDHLDAMPQPKVVYGDMPPYGPHGWKYIAFDKKGWIYMAFGPPCNECMPPTSNAQVRHINPKNGEAEIVALGVRNSVGGDVDPRTGDYWFSENARDWLSEDTPADKLEHITRMGEHFGYPYCHQGNIPDPVYAMGHKCSEFSPPAALLGAHVAPLGMKFYTGSQFPAEYKDNIFLAEHGSWNRHKYQGGRIERIIVNPKGDHVKQEVFADGWLQGPTKYIGRPADVIVAKDGSLLVADDFAGAIYRISYGK
ncbi:MAG TPA: PQQ-dependent sugar dehydrogenase [Stellaceae bacterium]|jgi:glucose/arabinose dehydrogenase|nr:PQQ-dependent sugar dehydrogenase [Stellaceae bacterium]